MPLKIWLNAFIPKNVPDYTQSLPDGKTAIPLPWEARPVNWKARNTGYLSDQRGFLSDEAASARMHSTVEIDTEGSFSIKQEHVTSGTTEVNLETGKMLAFGKASMDRCKYSIKPGESRPNKVIVCLVGKAGDPLVNLSADIDYIGEFTVTKTAGNRLQVDFTGKVDSFPAFECYARYNGNTKTVFTLSPPKGNTVLNLLGYARTPVTGSVTF